MQRCRLDSEFTKNDGQKSYDNVSVDAPAVSLIRASTKIDLAELLGVAVDVVGDLGIDGGKFQFNMVHLGH
jgi:hypothetical protein